MSLQLFLNRPACGEPGRQMFFDHVGQYFAAAPRLRRLPSGTVCSRCGATNVQLWMTDSNETSCLVQLTITRKRKARTSPEQPAVPAQNPSGKTNMGDGNMVVAGPHVARVITRVLPDRLPPPSLHIIFSQKSSIRAGLLDLLQNPPEPPFVAIRFTKKATFTTRITIDRSQIFINGAEPKVAIKKRLEEHLATAQRLGKAEFYRMMDLRFRLAGGKVKADTDREKDQAALLKARERGLLSPSEFRSLPDPGSDEAFLLRTLID